MGGKNTQTTTNSTQGYTPAGLSSLQDILSRAQQVSQTPYEPYGGQLTAGLSGTQQQGIQNINNAYGTAQPYINTAAGYAQQGAESINPQQIQQYSNPYQQQVIDATMANINKVNAQQQQQVVGNAALQGALGGDRVKIAQSALAGQQGLANNQTLAGLNTQNYQQALAAAQADRAARGQAAYTYGNLGGVAQNAALQGAGAQLQAGGLEQQTQQAGLTAQYQQYLQRLAFPYQQAQFLAGIGLPAAGMMGGTTQGQSTTQGPQPNIFGQILGGATAIGSFFNRGGKVRGFDGGGAVNFMEVPSYVPRPFQIGGGGQQHQPTLPNAPVLQPQQSTMDMVRAGMGAGRGFSNVASGISDLFNPYGYSSGNSGGTGLEGYGGLYAHGGTVRGYDDGGFVNDPLNFEPRPDGSFGMADQLSPDGGDVSTQTASPFAVHPQHYANAISGIESGGNYQTVGPQTSSGDRAFGKYQVMGSNVGPWTEAVLGKQLTPQEFLSDPKAQDAVFNAKFGTYVDKYGPEGAAKAWFAGEGGMNDPNRRDILGTTVSSYADKFKNALGLNGDNAALPASATPTQYQQQSPSVFSKLGEMFGSGKSQPVDQNRPTLFGQPMTDQRMALLGMGLGMMASPSPYLGVQIGQGGMQGLQMMQQSHQQELQRNQAQQKIDLQAQQMMRQAQQFAQEFGLKKEQFGIQQQTAERQTRAQEISALAPVKIGADMMGREIYGIRDPKSGAIIPIDPDTGKPRTSSVSPFGQTPITNAPNAGLPAGQATVYQPPADSPVSKDVLINPIDHPVNEDVIKTLPVGLQQQVKLLAAGRIAPPSSFAAAKLYWQGLLSLAAQYDPKFDAINYGSRQAALKDVTSGVSARNLTSLNTVMQHVDELNNAGATLDNWKTESLGVGTRLANKATEWLRENKQDPRLTRFNVAADAVANEAEKAFKGNMPSVQGIQEWRKNLNPAMSPEQMQSANKTLLKLLEGRIDAVTEQYRRAFGSTRDPIEFLAPKAKATFERLSSGKQPAATTEVSPPDKKALEWANSNPNDPRADAIKKKLGIP